MLKNCFHTFIILQGYEHVYLYIVLFTLFKTNA